uniref:I/LWEQ domain-containing protein n=1 Tax=Oncorhynchus mykiss TaxID=8022 RepID=A0A8C7V531_ONCMY
MTETNLGAERDHFDKKQLSSISKAINSNEAPVKEKHARRIILGTYREKGAFTFWSYALGIPLSSNAIVSWKFCHVLHKVLRDGHHNVKTGSPLYSVLGFLFPHNQMQIKTCREKRNLHHSEIRSNLEVTDEVLERVAGTDVNNLNTSIAISTTTSGQCRLSPLIQVIQDCSHLYHFTVKLLFKLHACLPADTLQGHRDRFHDQFHSLETELEEQRVQKQRALVENEQLRMELEATRRRNAEHEIATEQRYTKLKEKHTELVSSHAELLRKSADTVKILSATQQTQEEVERTKQQLAFEVDRIKLDADMKLEEQKFEMKKLKRDFEEKQAEVEHVKGTLQRTEKVGEQLTSSMLALQAEKERLMRSASEKEAELSSLSQAAQLQQSSLQQERDQSTRELGELQGKLQEKSRREVQLQQKLLEEQFSLLQGTVSEAEYIIQDAVAKLDDPLHIRCTSSPDYLVSRAEATLGSIDKVKKGHSDYLTNMGDTGGLLRALTNFSHLAADTIINGSATAHLAPTDHADRLTENCRGCATQSLQFLKDLKSKASLQRADPASIRIVVEKILKLGEELRPKGMDVRQDELGDLVDKEMAATSAAIEKAVSRIDEMMNQARMDTSGVKLEVNERILYSCTDLMKAIHLLVLTSTDLQKEIVEGGRGAATIKEFYARNSRWTEGLISASKAVGWGATQMVESADKVVLHTGKYEELIVCSHEIAASTAQLVASSKVKADRNSTKLTALQQASRHVNEMAANVVASTKTGQEHLEDKDTMDFSGMSLIKLKMEEMESQVKVLELENQLGNERLRLGELRKKHYNIAGVPAADLPEGNGLDPSLAPVAPSSPKSSKPSVMRKPDLAQKPNLPPKNMVREQSLGLCSCLG